MDGGGRKEGLGREICALQWGESGLFHVEGMVSLGSEAGWVLGSLSNVSEPLCGLGTRKEQRRGPALGDLPVTSLTQARVPDAGTGEGLQGQSGREGRAAGSLAVGAGPWGWTGAQGEPSGQAVGFPLRG